MWEYLEFFTSSWMKSYIVGKHLGTRIPHMSALVNFEHITRKWASLRRFAGYTSEWRLR